MIGVIALALVGLLVFVFYPRPKDGPHRGIPPWARGHTEASATSLQSLLRAEALGGSVRFESGHLVVKGRSGGGRLPLADIAAKCTPRNMSSWREIIDGRLWPLLA